MDECATKASICAFYAKQKIFYLTLTFNQPLDVFPHTTELILFRQTIEIDIPLKKIQYDHDQITTYCIQEKRTKKKPDLKHSYLKTSQFYFTSTLEKQRFETVILEKRILQLQKVFLKKF